MKATTTILAAVLTLSMNVLFASNDGAAVNSETNSFHISLVPSTPTEATFEDMTVATINLAPIAPIEADFSDVAPEVVIDFSIMAPVTPSEADFSNDEILTDSITTLAPVTPDFADFTENI